MAFYSSEAFQQEICHHFLDTQYFNHVKDLECFPIFLVCFYGILNVLSLSASLNNVQPLTIIPFRFTMSYYYAQFGLLSCFINAGSKKRGMKLSYMPLF